MFKFYKVTHQEQDSIEPFSSKTKPQPVVCPLLFVTHLSQRPWRIHEPDPVTKKSCEFMDIFSSLVSIPKAKSRKGNHWGFSLLAHERVAQGGFHSRIKFSTKMKPSEKFETCCYPGSSCEQGAERTNGGRHCKRSERCVRNAQQWLEAETVFLTSFGPHQLYRLLTVSILYRYSDLLKLIPQGEAEGRRRSKLSVCANEIVDCKVWKDQQTSNISLCEPTRKFCPGDIPLSSTRRVLVLNESCRAFAQRRYAFVSRSAWSRTVCGFPSFRVAL
jgi:hypothetical protein